jgi:thioredoxin 1
LFYRALLFSPAQLAAAFQVRSIPTLMILREQIMVYAQPGMLSATQLEELLNKAGELDMDEVRAEIAKQQGAQDAG